MFQRSRLQKCSCVWWTSLLSASTGHNLPHRFVQIAEALPAFRRDEELRAVGGVLVLHSESRPSFLAGHREEEVRVVHPLIYALKMPYFTNVVQICSEAAIEILVVRLTIVPSDHVFLSTISVAFSDAQDAYH